MWILSWCGAGKRLRIVFAGAALIAFVNIVGPDASVQRAGIMAAVMLVSGFGSKRARSLPALGCAMLVMLLADPWQARAPGFALSVAATAGIVLLTPVIERGMEAATHRVLGRRAAAGRGKVPRWVTLPVAVATSAQLACGPLVLLLQPGLPTMGVAANVFAGIVAPLGTGLGLLALIALAVWPALGQLLVIAASGPARIVAWIAEAAATLPGARLAWPGGWSGAVLLGLVEAALLVAWFLRPKGPLTPVARRGGPWRPPIRRTLAASVFAAALVAAAAGVFLGPTAVAPLISRAAVPRDWNIVVCDVGQGDAILLRDHRTPDTVILVDTGDDPEKLAHCLTQFGVKRIALLVLTHDDRDHIGALGTVLGRTDAALVAPENQKDGTNRSVIEQLDAAGVPTTDGAAGMNGAHGGLAWRVLAPEKGAQPADSNAASLVLMVQTGTTRTLLLADTGEDEQRSLAAKHNDLSADIVKIAHHGSRDQLATLPEQIGAQVALVSVGAGNSYGHPTSETMEAYALARRGGAAVLRTDLYGSIALSSDALSGTAPDIWVERAPE